MPAASEIPCGAVVGWPVTHTLSPAIFKIFGTLAGRPIQYRAIALSPDSFEDAFRRAADGSWVGWNITSPHKVAALRLADRVDAAARDAGAVNVVRFHKRRCFGFNTDIEGFLSPLIFRGFDVKGKRVLVFGAGGAARAVCAACRRAGAKNLFIAARTGKKARELARAFGGVAVPWTPGEIARQVTASGLVVNATTLGSGGLGSPLPGGTRFKPSALAYDLVYHPRMTPFLKTARDAGAQTLGGLPMLVAQAAATWRIWFDDAVPPNALREVEAELAR